MKIRVLLLCLALLPVLANAEIYKWKDKDGRVRYSDVPPPSNIKHEPMHGKTKSTGQPPLAPVEGDVTAQMNRNKAAAEKEKAEAAADKSQAEKTPLSKEEAAKKRAKDAEEQKKADEAKQAELKLKQENCKSARSNLAAYTNGGRILKVNEKGEREYLGDKEIDQARMDAQKDVEKYCD